MKVRIDFVTNSSSSSFITYRLSDWEYKNKCAYKNKSKDRNGNKKEISVCSELENYFQKSYDTKREVLAVTKALNNKYKLGLSDKDIIREKHYFNRGEATAILAELYGIVSSNCIEVCVEQKGLFSRYKIEFLSDVTINPKIFLSKYTIQENIAAFIRNYRDSSKSITQVITAYIKALSNQNKNIEEILELLEGYTNEKQIIEVLAGKDISIFGDVEEINIMPDRITIMPGFRKKLNLQVKPTKSVDYAIFIWISSNENVVAVDSRGVVEAINPGNAVITVTTIDSKHISCCEVIVQEFNSNK